MKTINWLIAIFLVLCIPLQVTAIERILTIPMPEDGIDDGIPPVIKIEISEEEANFLESERQKGIPGYGDGVFTLMILGDGYSPSEEGHFRKIAEEVGEYVLGREPFSMYSTSLEIVTSSLDLQCAGGCHDIPRLICCETEHVLTAAENSGLEYDEIIVIANISEYGGSGYRDMGYYEYYSQVSYAVTYDGEWSAPVALHEAGHSIGNLCDEYEYHGLGNYTYIPCVNCVEKCSDLGGSICQLGCDAESSYYRPENSVMLSLAFETFNQPSINGLRERLDYFTRTCSAQNLDLCNEEKCISTGLNWCRSTCKVEEGCSGVLFFMPAILSGKIREQ